MGTKNNPGEFDCYGNAAADEPMFILLARDPKAPAVVEEWARKYHLQHAGKWTADRERKCREALDCAASMRRWYSENRHKLWR